MADVETLSFRPPAVTNIPMLQAVSLPVVALLFLSPPSPLSFTTLVGFVSAVPNFLNILAREAASSFFDTLLALRGALKDLAAGLRPVESAFLGGTAEACQPVGVTVLLRGALNADCEVSLGPEERR